MRDFETFLDLLQEENETMLSRLGSSRSLYADTHGDLEPKPVLEAAAIAEHAAGNTFAMWADDEQDETAQSFFERVAERERTHYETVLDELGVSQVEIDELPTLHVYLRGLTETVDRVGGFAGRCLVSKRSKIQTVGFFVGNADPQTADIFRSFGNDLDEQLSNAEAVFEAVCVEEASWEQAAKAATKAIEAAYEEYVENLEAQGVKPKPVC